MLLAKIALPLLALASGGLGTALASQQGTPTPPPPGPGLALINERCGFCHSTAQVTAVRKTPAAWAATVQAMMDRGAELEPEEQKTMVDYLAAHLATPANAAAR